MPCRRVTGRRVCRWIQSSEPSRYRHYSSSLRIMFYVVSSAFLLFFSVIFCLFDCACQVLKQLTPMVTSYGACNEDLWVAQVCAKNQSVTLSMNCSIVSREKLIQSVLIEFGLEFILFCFGFVLIYALVVFDAGFFQHSPSLVDLGECN